MPDAPLLTSGQRGGLRIALGAISILLGFVALIWPGVTLLVVAVLFGLELIAAGVVRVVAAATLTGLPDRLRPDQHRCGHRRADLPRRQPRIGGVILLIVGVVSLLSVFAGRRLLSADAGTPGAAH